MIYTLTQVASVITLRTSSILKDQLLCYIKKTLLQFKVWKVMIQQEFKTKEPMAENLQNSTLPICIAGQTHPTDTNLLLSGIVPSCQPRRHWIQCRVLWFICGITGFRFIISERKYSVIHDLQLKCNEVSNLVILVLSENKDYFRQWNDPYNKTAVSFTYLKDTWLGIEIGAVQQIKPTK